MFISNLINRLDKADPYAIQRVVLGKALFTATLLVFVYWIFRPSNFTMFISPMLVVSFYETPRITSFQDKERLLLFVFAATIIGSVTFYLMYPFRIMFFFYAIIFFAVLYHLVIKYFGQLKHITMIILATVSVALAETPPANLQIVYNMFTSSLLSTFTMFLCLRMYPNHSLIIWRRATQKFIACLENDIESAILQQDRHFLSDEIKHLGTIRAFRRLLPKHCLKHTFRISIDLRNIQFALDNLYFETKNDVFWHAVQHHFAQLRHSIHHQIPCPMPGPLLLSETPLQKYVIRCLSKATHRWNRLCHTQSY